MTLLTLELAVYDHNSLLTLQVLNFCVSYESEECLVRETVLVKLVEHLNLCGTCTRCLHIRFGLPLATGLARWFNWVNICSSNANVLGSKPHRVICIWICFTELWGKELIIQCFKHIGVRGKIICNNYHGNICRTNRGMDFGKTLRTII